jgi:hypothetical protein
MAQAADHDQTRRSRFWLFAPFVLLALVAVAWSAAWFVMRDRTEAAIDAMLGREARAGRQWDCKDRSIAGFPFRLEVTCASLTVRRSDVTASFGRIEAVAQVYQPRHVITEVVGPLRVSDGTVTVEATWRLLETSVHGSPAGFERISLVAEEPAVTITGTGPAPLSLTGQNLEAHLRPNPARRQTEGAYDAALTARQATIPGLDAFVGSNGPTDLQVDLTATQVEGFRGRPVLTEIERWRQANGRIEVLRLAASKGASRLEAKGDLGLDEMHRPVGRVEAAAAGLDGLINRLTGGRPEGGLLSALLGQAPLQGGTARSEPALSPLPPLRFDDGRVLFGPFKVPGLRLPPLY